MQVPLRTSLLTLAQDAEQRMITRHEYAADAKTAAAISPGEYYRFEYTRISASETRTLFFNESAGTRGEYVMINGKIVDVSDDHLAGCELEAAHYVRGSDGVVSEKVDAPVNHESLGVRTTYDKNAFGQPTLVQENWSGVANALATDVENPSTPVRVHRYSYLSGSHLISEEGPVYSVACARADDFGLDCALTSVEPKTEYDYDTDYDGDFNEDPGPWVTQVRQSGLTSSDNDQIAQSVRLTLT